MVHTEQKNTAKARGRRKILLVALTAALPLIIAYALFYSGWRPGSTANYGELVQPARPIADATLQTLDKKKIRFSEWRGKWTLITFSPAECLSPCEKTLYNLRQVVAAQGEEAKRVQSVFIVTDPKALVWLHYAIKDYPDMLVIVGPMEDVRTLARQFVLPDGSPPEGSQRIYLVDPLGNLMMSYPPGADPTGLRKDLARLLRISQIG
jgi:cytochrome oxidase Cu insertion factor (SCO1/SenC/PrrC family)